VGGFVLKLFDGARNPLAPGVSPLVTVRTQGGANLFSRFLDSNLLRVSGLQQSGAEARYVVMASASKHKDGGFGPFPLSAVPTEGVSLMLVERDAAIHFDGTSWATLQEKDAALCGILGGSDRNKTGTAYDAFLSQRPESLACLFNCTAAIVALGEALPGKPALLELFHEVEIETYDGHDRRGLARDRFFGYSEPALRATLEAQLKGSGGTGLLSAAPPGLHPGADTSYKEIRFGEANLQFTFATQPPHVKTINVKGVDVVCDSVEVDMDYFHDKASHVFLEVVPNTIDKKMGRASAGTDPRTVYGLRWMAGKNAKASSRRFEPYFQLRR
jgi:hypothetical protein